MNQHSQVKFENQGTQPHEVNNNPENLSSSVLYSSQVAAPRAYKTRSTSHAAGTSSNRNHTTYQQAENYGSTSMRYSPHEAHHMVLNQQDKFEKQFNYAGSRIRSLHHNPYNNRVRARLSSLSNQNETRDSMVNNSQVGGNCSAILDFYHDCGETCANKHSGNPSNNVNNNSAILSDRQEITKPKETQPILVSAVPRRALQLAQPFGSGVYANQIMHLKTGIDFHRSNRSKGEQKLNTSQLGNRTSGKSTFKEFMESKRNEEKLREQLYFDERTKTIPKSTIKNRVIEEIVSEGDVFVGNKQLLGSVFKLKTLNLLKQNETNINRYAPGSTIFPFVFNDYHSKSTNNGYSRQEKGGFFFTR